MTWYAARYPLAAIEEATICVALRGGVSAQPRIDFARFAVVIEEATEILYRGREIVLRARLSLAGRMVVLTSTPPLDQDERRDLHRTLRYLLPGVVSALTLEVR